MDAVVSESRDMIRAGSKSFAGAARLLDPGVRESVYQLYAWCRYCDDRIDGQELGHGMVATPQDTARDRLQDLRRRTDAALVGHAPSDDTVFVALQRVVERHRIPPEHPHALLDGFAMDVEERRYESLEDVLEYCYHVAGVVGVMMALTMGAREPEALDRASDLGLALQMTNIARDVMDDAEAGRFYLPGDWLGEAGVPLDEIREPRHRRAVSGVVRRFLTEADRYYRSAGAGLPFLSLRCAWSIATARDVYRDIGRAVLRRGGNAWDTRTVVSKPRKLFRVASGGVDALLAKSAGRGRFRSRTGLWTRPRPGGEA